MFRNDEGKCQCQEPLEKKGNRCVKVVTKILCPEGSTRVGDKCIRCPAAQYLFEGKCTCPEPLIKKGNRCEEEEVVILTPKCLPPKYINDEGKCVTPPQITLYPSSLPKCTYDAAYPPPSERHDLSPGVQLEATGGTAPYTFNIAGKLPSGLTLSPSGLLSGVAEEEGDFSLVVGALDAKQFSGVRNYTLSCKGPEFSCPPGMVRFGGDCVSDGSEPPAPPPTLNLACPLQKELKRIGCYRGKIDCDFGRNSKRALAMFVERAKLNINASEPTQAALSAAEEKKKGFCPPPPPPKQQTVKKKAPKGKKTSGLCGYQMYRKNGVCVCAGGLKKVGNQCVSGGPSVIIRIPSGGGYSGPGTSYGSGGGCRRRDDEGRCY
ncbi:MAG: Ig domain-containing protein [Hyphomicrobiales bacterium]|nr:Ig domain-containing protein [Hyphomicrobiales bacterium]